MQYLIYGITTIGTLIVEFIKKYWPRLIARFGWQTIALSVQKIFSGIIIALVFSFWAGLISFVISSYVRVSAFIETLNTLPNVGGGGSSQWISCFASMLNASGINAGFASALPLLASSIIFVLSTVLYVVTKELLVVIGNELSKHLNLITK